MTDFYQYGVYFRPELLVNGVAALPFATALQTTVIWASGAPPGSGPVALVVDGVKWCVVLAVAVWLSVAQLAARRRRRERE